MYPKDSMLSPLFDHFTFDLSSKGLISKLREDYLPELETCESKTFNPVNLSLVKILFYFLAIGILFSVIISIIEKCKGLRTDKKVQANG